MTTSGWYTFLHHENPIEWTDDLDERLTYIKRHKPVSEQAIRRRCIVSVPEARLPRAYDEAWRAYAEATRANDEARRAYDEARRAYDEARRAYAEATRAYDEAWRAYDEATRPFHQELVALALALVPDAPWDGRKLVFA